MLQSAPRPMMQQLSARTPYPNRGSASERWSRRRTLGFILVTNGTIWGVIAWSLAAMAHR